MSSKKQQASIQKAAPATIQTWITATERIVMGTRELLELLADRVSIVDNRVTARMDELEKRLAVVEESWSATELSKTSSTDDSETPETTG